MSQTLTLNVNDQVYESLRLQAEAVGKSPEQVAESVLETQFNGTHSMSDVRSAAEKEKARMRLRSLFGSADLGRPTGADNDAIDADLAREYGDPHEPS